MNGPPQYNTTGAWRRRFDTTLIKGGKLYIDSATLGFSLTNATRVIMSCDAEFSVKVEYPDGSYGDHPDGAITGDANDIVTVTGRWNSFEITTAGNLTIDADFTLGAWHK